MSAPLLPRLRHAPAGLAGLLLCLGGGGCGWHAGLVPAELAAGRTVGVEIFGTNRDRVLVRDLEPLLHDELSRAVSDLAALPLAPPERADVVVRGRIVEVRRRAGLRRAGTGERDPRNDLLETSLRIVVSAELVERSTGKVLRPSRNAGVSSGYAVSVENEEAARSRALRWLAETLVLDMFGGEALESSGDGGREERAGTEEKTEPGSGAPEAPPARASDGSAPW